jgi:hypothetical protein
VPTCLHAQDKPSDAVLAKESADPETAFLVQVVVSEFNGANKVSSLPYTISASSHMPRTKLRAGARIPVIVGIKSGESSFQYLDIGTSIDCVVKPPESGKYSVDFIVERSSVYTVGTDGNKKEWTPGDVIPNTGPVLPMFKGEFSVLLCDGQTQEATAMTDPLSGHVTKIEVTLNTLK